MRRHRRHRFTALMSLMLIALSALGCASTRRAVDARTEPSEPWYAGVLDGEVKSILVNGYSTSFAWPDMLQKMLDEHAGGRERLYHVVNSTIGGAPVETWIAEPGTRDHERTIRAMERDFFGESPRLLGDMPRPTVAICQQSLQFTLDRRGPVKDESDMVGAEIGADALEKLALRLRGFGIERIYIGMHIYKQPVEPEIGNERIALARLLMRGLDFILPGPDVWTPTRDAYPEAFAEDGLHPSELGMKIMAEGWYRTLAADSVKQDVIDSMWARDYDVEAIVQAYLAWRRGE